MEYVPISQAAKLLNRSLNGVRMFIKQEVLRVRQVTKGKRITIEVCLDDIKLLAPRLGPRRFKIKDSESRTKEKSTGYIKVYMPQHSRAMCDGYVYEHWLVAESKLRRPLAKQEQVHHINRIRDDNRPENLHVYSSRSEHMRLAHSQLSEFLKNAYP